MNPTSETSLLPSFARPPINEVVLGVQFQPIKDMTTSHMGLFWAPIRKAFPLTEEKPALDPLIETFGGRLVGQVAGLRLLEKPETPRIWFSDKTNNKLIQLQQDRLHVNWRLRDLADVYPRYPSVRDLFEQELTRLLAFVESENLGAFVPTQAEITYVNSILLGDAGFSKPDQILNNFREFRVQAPGVQLEVFQSTFRCLVNDASGEPIARMTVQVMPGYSRLTDGALYKLELTVRGRPRGEFGVPEILGFLDHGRATIVQTFKDLTTERMHKEWGLNE